MFNENVINRMCADMKWKWYVDRYPYADTLLDILNTCSNELYIIYVYEYIYIPYLSIFDGQLTIN